MKIVTFNCNGLRSVLSKNKKGIKNTNDPNVLQTLINEHDPDILCLQETKCPSDLITNIPFQFKKIIAATTKKGYSGVAIFSKEQPIKVYNNFPLNEEGRLIAIEFDKVIVVNTYTPNSKPDLSRLEYRINIWEETIRNYINSLQQKKPIIFVSDFNVAPTEIDLHDPKKNTKSHGYTIEERTAFASLLKDCELVNTFRTLHPTKIAYTWFSNFAKSRERNKGWTIDHILVTKNLKHKIKSCEVLNDFYGSDHIPVIAEISI